MDDATPYLHGNESIDEAIHRHYENPNEQTAARKKAETFLCLTMCVSFAIISLRLSAKEKTHGKIHPLRKALEEKTAGAERKKARHMGRP